MSMSAWTKEALHFFVNLWEGFPSRRSDLALCPWRDEGKTGRKKGRAVSTEREADTGTGNRGKS